MSYELREGKPKSFPGFSKNGKDFQIVEFGGLWT